jgi:hypothetical protein
MNHRIKELLNQAGTDVSGKWMNVDNAEKFAELIVRECAELATKEYNNQGVIYVNDLLEHFGVKK